MVLGSVMPPKGTRRPEMPRTNIEYAFGVCRRVLVGIIGRRVHPREKRRGRKLLGIAYNHQLTAPSNRPDCLLRLELGRLVHDDQIKSDGAGRQVLSDRL